MGIVNKGNKIMTTLKDIYGGGVDDDSHHAACPKCGWCLVCDVCMCDWLRRNPDREAMRFPYVSTIEGPAMGHHRKMEEGKPR